MCVPASAQARSPPFQPHPRSHHPHSPSPSSPSLLPPILQQDRNYSGANDGQMDDFLSLIEHQMASTSSATANLDMNTLDQQQQQPRTASQSTNVPETPAAWRDASGADQQHDDDESESEDENAGDHKRKKGRGGQQPAAGKAKADKSSKADTEGQLSCPLFPLVGAYPSLLSSEQKQTRRGRAASRPARARRQPRARCVGSPFPRRGVVPAAHAALLVSFVGLPPRPEDARSRFKRAEIWLSLLFLPPPGRGQGLQAQGAEPRSPASV